MTKDLRLPRGYELPDRTKIRTLLYSGDAWQIFDSSGANNILLTRPELTLKWHDFGFIDDPCSVRFALEVNLSGA